MIYNKIQKINLIVALVILILISTVAFAHEEEILEGENLVKSKVSCNKLSDDQLESIGEYIMEQMHPGELHEIMDQRMGGEGSESLKLAHINIAKMMYCADKNAMPMNMMNIMMNRGGSESGFSNMMGYGFGNRWGMMGNWGLWYGSWTMLFWIVIIILAIYLVYKILQKRDFSFSSEDPLDILKKRYAKGEITRKEFEKMRNNVK